MYFSCAESGYAGVNKIRLKNLEEGGNKRATRALFISNNFDRALTTILIGTNVLHIGCSSIATLIATRLWGENAVAYATLVTTVIVFFFAELLPKSFANANSTKVALAFSGSMRFLMRILYPITMVFMGISQLVTRLFKHSEEPTVTEEELSNIIEVAQEEDVIDEDQSELLQSAMEFPSTTVRDVFTAREDIVAIECHMTHEEILAFIQDCKHSRLPVYDRTLDHIIGILSIRRYLKETLRKGTPVLRELMYKPNFVSPDDSIGKLLKQMTQNKLSLSVVRDKQGKTLGLLTVEDFLEELVGEIWDEDDVVDPNFMKLGGNRFSVSAMLTVEDVFRRIGYTPLAEDKNFISRPVGAWVMGCFGHEPEEEDEITFERLTLTVTEMEDGRITKLEVKINDEDGTPEPSETPTESEGETV